MPRTHGQSSWWLYSRSYHLLICPPTACIVCIIKAVINSCLHAQLYLCKKAWFKGNVVRSDQTTIHTHLRFISKDCLRGNRYGLVFNPFFERAPSSESIQIWSCISQWSLRAQETWLIQPCQLFVLQIFVLLYCICYGVFFLFCFFHHCWMNIRQELETTCNTWLHNTCIYLIWQTYMKVYCNRCYEFWGPFDTKTWVWSQMFCWLQFALWHFWSVLD